jgi:hypothetical protein
MYYMVKTPSIGRIVIFSACRFSSSNLRPLGGLQSLFIIQQPSVGLPSFVLIILPVSTELGLTTNKIFLRT